MEAHAGDKNRAAIAVVTGIGNVLQVHGRINSADDPSGVIAFNDFFVAVGQVSVSEKEAEAAELQITRVLLGDAISDKGEADFVARSMPALSENVSADRYRVIDFGECERLVMPLIPSGARKQADRRRPRQ